MELKSFSFRGEKAVDTNSVTNVSHRIILFTKEQQLVMFLQPIRNK